MHIIRTNETCSHVNSPVCIAHEYVHQDADVSCARIEVKGRYPDVGSVANTRCKELVYVLSGTVLFTCDENKNTLAEGDSVLIDVHEAFVWEGDAVLLVVCTPAWTPEQHVMQE